MARRKVTFDKVSEDEVEPPKIDEIPFLTNKIMTLPIHLPIILYGMFYYGITSDVQQVMVKGLTTLIMAQIVYGYLIYVNVSGDGKKKKNKDNLFLLLASSIIIPIFLSLPVFGIVILMGAPLASHLYETLLLAAHVSLIIFTPVIVLFKLNFSKFSIIVQKIDLKSIWNNSILLSILASIIATWCGVIPIPLDWDRPWQNWPITLLVGSYLGYFLGSFIKLFI
ncbi:glycosylphosphatidylinositol anchor biosynthesis protein 11 [[Candida] jaroonii]|uniref:Glycosylphosphatidylinositol anchor biosynthesis protein 11 n=1 Tax=[Candida] jaroonii TaxID=467808 RepID=A0ACA9YFU4_9ASCO|nr:glycosylphosphatidylinositol anchor biosynthesis protein 11 [[Candida] jaroonii]